MRQRHDLSAWCYVSGWVSVLETQLLGEDVYTALLESGAPETAWGVLSKTGYRSHLGRLEDLRHFEQWVQEFSREQRTAIGALCPQRDLVAFFEFDRRYRMERARWTSSEEKEDHETDVPRTVEAFLRIYSEMGYPLFVEDYQAILEGRDLWETGRSGGLSNFLDSLYLSLLLTWGRRWPGTLIHDYVERYVWFKVAEVALRSVRRGVDVAQLDRYLFLGPLRTDPVAAMLEGEEYPDVLQLVEVLLPSGFAMPAEVNSSLEAFQRGAERFLLEIVWPARYVVFGPEKVFGYLCGLRNQEANMRFCLSTVLYSLDPRLTGERLRPIYV